VQSGGVRVECAAAAAQAAKQARYATTLLPRVDCRCQRAAATRRRASAPSHRRGAMLAYAATAECQMPLPADANERLLLAFLMSPCCSLMARCHATSDLYLLIRPERYELDLYAEAADGATMRARHAHR